MSRLKPLHLVAGAAATVAALILFGWLFGGVTFGLGEGAGEGGYEVRRGDLSIGVEITGTLRAIESQLLGPPAVPDTWNYKISFMAPEGSEAKPGMPVLRFDTQQLQQQLEQKVAERDSAATELEKRRVDLTREVRDMELQLAEARGALRRAELKVEVPEGLQSAQELSEAKLDLQVARAEVASLERRLELVREGGEAEVADLREKRDRAIARVSEIEQYIGRMTVAAPRAGTVIYVSDWRGDKMKVGDDVWQARKVLEIPDLSRMEASGFVDESDAGRIEVGQPVTLRLDAHPESEYRAEVSEIARAVQRKDRGNPIKQVEITITLADTDTERMRPGMRFQGEVEVDRAEGVLLAPAEAVRSTAEGPRALRRTWNGVEVVHPEVGRRNERFVEILSGLEEGTRLVPPEEEG